MSLPLLSSSIREVDALALYHSCLGRIIPYLLEDLFLSFSAVCTGLVIGEGQDYDLERISLLLNSLDILLQASDASGNTLLSDTVVSYFVILDVCLMKGITDHCLRRICFENGMTGVMYLLGLSYILKAASDADGDILVCNTIEKIFSDTRIQFSKPPRR